MLRAINGFLGATPERSESLLLPLIHVNLIAYACAFWMQQPVLPAKLRSVSASEVDYGTLQSASAMFALLGSTFMGR
jgi:hypothetical protein